MIGATTVTTNVWHHAAATFDGTTRVIYLDGVLDGVGCRGPNPPRFDSIQHAGIATAMTSTGVPPGYFAGVIDEARIWNVARVDSDIQASMRQELTSGHRPGCPLGVERGIGDYGERSVAPAQNGTLHERTRLGQRLPRRHDPGGPDRPHRDPGRRARWPSPGTPNGESDLAGYNVYRGTSSPVTKGTPLNGGALLTSPAYTDTSGDARHSLLLRRHRGRHLRQRVGPLGRGLGNAATPTAGQLRASIRAAAAPTSRSATRPSSTCAQFTIETWFKRTGTGTRSRAGTDGIADRGPAGHPRLAAGRRLERRCELDPRHRRRRPT